jgi:hypothetical protein
VARLVVTAACLSLGIGGKVGRDAGFAWEIFWLICLCTDKAGGPALSVHFELEEDPLKLGVAIGATEQAYMGTHAPMMTLRGERP